MVERTAEQLLHEFRSSATADVTMSLLRSKDALLYMALMAAHLGDGQIVDGQTLSAAIDADLPALMRSYTPEETDDDTLIPSWDADTLGGIIPEAHVAGGQDATHVGPLAQRRISRVRPIGEDFRPNGTMRRLLVLSTALGVHDG